MSTDRRYEVGHIQSFTSVGLGTTGAQTCRLRKRALRFRRPLFLCLSFILCPTRNRNRGDRAAFPQVLALFAGKGEGKDGVGFVPFSSSAADESDLQTLGVVLDSTSFYAEGGGQVGYEVSLLC